MSHRQVILIDDIPGWPAVNVCCSFKNTMLTKIGKVDYSFLRRERWSLSPSVIGERFLRTIWLYFLPFSLDLNLVEYINRQIRILRSDCQENIAILNITAFVVFKSLTPDEISWFDIQTDTWTKWKVTNAIFDDAVGTIQYNSLLTLPWWGFSVTMRLKKKKTN